MQNFLFEHIQQRVAVCRRLAGNITDDRAAEILLRIADEGEADLKSASGRRPAACPDSYQVAPLDKLRALLPTKPKAQLTEDHMLSLICARRGREALFGSHLFADPAWDIILELYAARLGNRQMSVSGLARAVGFPQSVIQRWVAALLDAGVVCPNNSETAGVELTQEAASKMGQLAERWRAAFVAIRGC